MNYKLTLVLIVSASLVLGIIYIIIIPPWQSPDEPTHFEYVKVLAEGDPPWDPHPSPELQEKIIVSLDHYDYWRYLLVEKPDPLPTTFKVTPFLFMAPSQIGKNPPIYYWLASLVLRLTSNLSIKAEFYRLRALSLLFSILTVVFVWACAAEIFGKFSPLCPAAAGITALLPQFMVIGTSVSPDPCVNFFGTGAIYLILRFQRRGYTIFRIIFLLLWHGIGVLVNYKFVILLGALPGVVLIHLYLRQPRTYSFKKLLFCSGVVIVMLLISYAGMAWYFPRIARLFVIRTNILYSTISTYFQSKTSFPPGYWPWFSLEVFKSFWLKYGWLTYELPLFFYRILQIASLIALAGLGLFWGKIIIGKNGGAWPAREGILTLILYASAALVAYYLFWGLKVTGTTTQGRHLFIVMPAWAILFILGWIQFFPARFERGVSLGILSAFALFTIISICFFILPTFH